MSSDCEREVKGWKLFALFLGVVIFMLATQLIAENWFGKNLWGGYCPFVASYCD